MVHANDRATTQHIAILFFISGSLRLLASTHELRAPFPGAQHRPRVSSPTEGVDVKNRKQLAVGIALIIMTASCGGKKLTLPEYFDRFSAITSVMDQKTQDLQTKADSALVAAKTDAERLRVLQDSLEEQTSVVSAAVDGWRSLEPPEEAKAAHDTYVAAIDGYVQDVTAGLEAFDTYKTMQEAQEGILTPELEAASTSIDAGCLGLQKIATDNGIEVDLHCGGGQESAPEP